MTENGERHSERSDRRALLSDICLVFSCRPGTPSAQEGALGAPSCDRAPTAFDACVEDSGGLEQKVWVIPSVASLTFAKASAVAEAVANKSENERLWRIQQKVDVTAASAGEMTEFRVVRR